MQVSFNRTVNTQPTSTYNVNRTKKALSTTSAWFAFGVGLDCVGRNCTVFKSPAKNSLLINSVISSAAGLYAFFSKDNR